MPQDIDNILISTAFIIAEIVMLIGASNVVKLSIVLNSTIGTKWMTEYNS